jgi:hypothetical protein
LLLFNSRCEQKPGRADAIIRWLHLVTELEDGNHYGFLCLRYSATGRRTIASGNAKKNVTALDMNSA